MQGYWRTVTRSATCVPKSFAANRARRVRPSQRSQYHRSDNRRSAAVAAASVEADLVEVELKIDGLMCESCDSRVKKALTEMEGVKDARVSHESGMATIQVDAANLLDAWNQVPKLVEAVTALGFKAEPYLDG